jgi:hypothetical protein
MEINERGRRVNKQENNQVKKTKYWKEDERMKGGNIVNKWSNVCLYIVA